VTVTERMLGIEVNVKDTVRTRTSSEHNQTLCHSQVVHVFVLSVGMSKVSTMLSNIYISSGTFPDTFVTESKENNSCK